MGLRILEFSTVFIMQGITFYEDYGRHESDSDKRVEKFLFSHMFFRNLLLSQIYFYVISFNNKKIHLFLYFKQSLLGPALQFS